ncbi:hypothetical protein VHEMI08265 [[Torrubiella] hemipterigena]|uniref:Benzoate 4-monooxygenase cytochrome P450 n=1 Tax=[Torrubiella] hemipterigena TaxID=1531966 RepID=A0A0A1TPF4_9HYPO|nr:hypothetical protein VHEMI08265 [[Torrubiella] hemipterigena]
MLKLHEIYGPVVRVAPNELSFDSAKSWADIYGVRKEHGNCFRKSRFYDGGNFADQAASIVSQRDHEKHQRMRKFLSRAFSEASLREQESLISDTINQFVARIAKEDVIDFTHWFNLLTFDIIGKLAFGRDFKGISTGETHFWINDVLGSMAQASVADTLARFPILGKVWLWFNPSWLSSVIKASTRHQQYTIDITNKRINEPSPQKDFMSYLTQDRDGVSDIQLAAHASDFVIAGSETTATTLAVVFYQMCTNITVQRKLENEVLTAFQSYNDITAASAAPLKYLHAVCLEAMRVFPPLPLGLPRDVPPEGSTIDSVYVPGGVTVSTNPYAACMNAESFSDPQTFDPERWLNCSSEDVLEASKPFSHGPRACLGRSLAWLELHVIIARLIYSYEFLLADEPFDWNANAEMHLLWKKPKLRMKLKQRCK